MKTGNTIQSDDRQRRLNQLGWLLHAACAASLFVAAVFYCVGVLLPLSAREKTLLDQVAKVSDELSRSDNVSDDLMEVRCMLEQQRQRAAEVRKQIPDRSNEEEFLRALSEAAAASGVVIGGFNGGEVVHEATHSYVDINLECEGSYESICWFLERLEKVPRVARIMSLGINAEERLDRYPLTLGVRLYFGVHRSVNGNRTTAQGPHVGGDSGPRLELSEGTQRPSRTGGRRG